MSAESGIQTFRGSDGLWEQHRIEDVATPEAWARNPEMVQRFYNQRRQNILNASPNLAHQLIAQLENRYDVQIITQNIDDLHERAGSSSVLHLHGNIRLAKSSGPNAQYTAEFYPIQGAALDLEKDKCPAGYPLRPHVVWFGEAVPAYEEARALARQAERPRILSLEAIDLDLGAPAVLPAAPGNPPAPADEGAVIVDLRSAVDAYQRQLVLAALARHQDNWAAAARELGLDRANLGRMAKRLGLK